jgi:hypothetical protein
MSCCTLFHEVIFEDSSKIALHLSYSDEFKKYGLTTFPLLSDPSSLKKAVLVGVFVLRPTLEDWEGAPDSFYAGF